MDNHSLIPPHSVSNSDTPPAPFVPDLHKLNIFIKGGIWFCLGGLWDAAGELWQALTRYKTDPIDWGHIFTMAGLSVAPLILAYIAKYKAWLEAPPGTEIVRITETQVASPGQPVTTLTSTESLSVVPVVVPKPDSDSSSDLNNPTSQQEP